MRPMKKSNHFKLPDKWKDYEPFGKIVPGTNILMSKVFTDVFICKYKYYTRYLWDSSSSEMKKIANKFNLLPRICQLASKKNLGNSTYT